MLFIKKLYMLGHGGGSAGESGHFKCPYMHICFEFVHSKSCRCKILVQSGSLVRAAHSKHTLIKGTDINLCRISRGEKGTKIFYLSKCTITLLKFVRKCKINRNTSKNLLK